MTKRQLSGTALVFLTIAVAYAFASTRGWISIRETPVDQAFVLTASQVAEPINLGPMVRP